MDHFETETKKKVGVREPEDRPSTQCDIVNSVHPMHCGGACMLKLHMKGGKVDRITSAGDIPRAGSYEADESLMPMQRRACLIGLSEKRRIFAPDRLKYPLIQTMERGNLKGFKRISWDEALDLIAQWYREMEVRKDTLGYLPILDEGGMAPYLGPYLNRFGNPSNGNLRAATFGAIGNYDTLKGNPPMDVLNSNYIVIWGMDIQATMPSLSFIVMKAKEAGIPVTVVDTKYTDTAGSFGNGDAAKPNYISVRPGTDGILLAAMANVIYRKNLHDEAFINKFCFGFYPGDQVVSQSKAHHPVTGEPYLGKTFMVPKGESFVEYLDELHLMHGGYAGVLKWAEKLTGVPGKVVETFAMEYATAKPAFMYSWFTGPQRTHNGMYFSWMMIAISAMTGNINKRGGGFGGMRTDAGYAVKLDLTPHTLAEPKYAPIYFSSFMLNDVLLHGSDGREPSQLRDDVIHMNGIDLGENAKLSVEMYVRGAVDGNIFNQIPNINKRLLAWKKLKHVVSYERFMSSTAAWSDLVLPVITNFEESKFRGQIVSDTFVVNGPMAPMYEAKPDWWINEQLAKRLGIEFVPRNTSDLEIMKEQWKDAELPEDYKKINPDVRLPSFEEIVEKGNFQLPVPKEKTLIHTDLIEAGEFDTDTGRINFYSPYFAERGRAVLISNRAQYVRPHEGYEDVVDGGKIGAKGIAYPLQFITPHVANRALSTYGNVPVIDEQMPHVAELHFEDASKRNIENGDVVYVFNDLGCIKIKAAVTHRILPGVVRIGQGATYRQSPDETYQAYFDSDHDGIPEMHHVPVDVGGCTNTITLDLNSGVLDPFFCGLGLNAGGALCEISKTKPD